MQGEEPWASVGGLCWLVISSFDGMGVVGAGGTRYTKRT